MLVLSRHVDEEIVITTPDGYTITLKPLEIRGDKVRLGLTADKEVIIHRREVIKRIEEEYLGTPQDAA